MSRTIPRSAASFTALFALAAATSCSVLQSEPEPAGGLFSSDVIDIGVVASDVEKSAAFYTRAVGLEEVAPFDVSADFGRDSGLSDHLPLHVRVFQLRAGEHATNLKLMQFPQRPGKLADHSFIHTTLGLSYITIRVSDLRASTARARGAGATVVAKSPVPIPDTSLGLTLLRDPDGNIIELVGPLSAE